MELTHYGHACVLVSTEVARLLIDPGTLSTGFEALTDLDAILITHEHADHVDVPKVLELLAGNRATRLVVDEVTADQFRDQPFTVARPGDALSIAGEAIVVLGGTHAPVYGDAPGCPNLAYLIGDQEFLHPGDSLFLPQHPVETLAVPLAGPWLKLAEAIDYVKAVGPQRVLPIHQGELTNPEKYVAMLDAFTAAG